MERDQASKFINDLLKLMVSRNGSDLFITGEFPPAMRIDSKIARCPPVLNASPTGARQGDHERQTGIEFRRTKECNFAISPPGLRHFRVCVLSSRSRVWDGDAGHSRHTL
jgi:twitching motility protein PilU